MAKLTPEDRENYKKLKEAFKKLGYQNQPPISELTGKTNNELNINLNDDTSELRRRINLVDSYLKFHALFLPEKSADIQEILGLNEQIDRSLKVVEDKILNSTDEIEDFQPDSLFLGFIPSGTNGNLQKWTKILIDDRDPNLKEEQIDSLTQAWEIAVSTFVEDARKPKSGGQVEPGQPDTFAHFFRIHKELEILYSRLADTETVQSSR
jgi:hypothetical protein